MNFYGSSYPVADNKGLYQANAYPAGYGPSPQAAGFITASPVSLPHFVAVSQPHPGAIMSSPPTMYSTAAAAYSPLSGGFYQTAGPGMSAYSHLSHTSLTGATMPTTSPSPYQTNQYPTYLGSQMGHSSPTYGTSAGAPAAHGLPVSSALYPNGYTSQLASMQTRGPAIGTLGAASGTQVSPMAYQGTGSAPTYPGALHYGSPY